LDAPESRSHDSLPKDKSIDNKSEKRSSILEKSQNGSLEKSLDAKSIAGVSNASNDKLSENAEFRRKSKSSVSKVTPLNLAAAQPGYRKSITQNIRPPSPEKQ
jgi:hypothetical protein